MDTMRHWMTLCEDSADDKYAYHVTLASNLAEITAKGLRPQKPGPDGWPEYDEDDEPEPLPPEAFEGRVFAWDDLGVAKTYASGYSTDTVILRMPLLDFDWESGQTDFRYLYTTQRIPPQALEVFGPDGQWHRLAARRRPRNRRIPPV